MSLFLIYFALVRFLILIMPSQFILAEKKKIPFKLPKILGQYRTKYIFWARRRHLQKLFVY